MRRVRERGREREGVEKAALTFCVLVNSYVRVREKAGESVCMSVHVCVCVCVCVCWYDCELDWPIRGALLSCGRLLCSALL